MARLKDQIFALRDPRMLLVFMQGIASGLPLYLAGLTLKAWLTESGVNIKTIGIFSIVSLPYSLKILWAPLIDRFPFPIGRRRGWIMLMQICIMGTLVAMSFCNPPADVKLMGVIAFALTFFSATQDIALDAWRREYLADNEIALGLALNTTSFLIAMRLISGALALILAEKMPWPEVYKIMALFMLPSLFCTIAMKHDNPDVPHPKSTYEAVVLPLQEFFARQGAWWIVAFVVLYKLGDNMGGALSTTYYLQLGYTKSAIAGASKIVGWISISAGTLLGGMLLLRMKLRNALWSFGIVQSAAIGAFIFLKIFPVSFLLLNCIVGFENFAAGIGTSAYATLIARLTNKKFTATQYALLTSLMFLSQNIFAAPTGYIQQALGWVGFYIFCAIIAIPGILLALRIKEDEHGQISI